MTAVAPLPLTPTLASRNIFVTMILDLLKKRLSPFPTEASNGVGHFAEVMASRGVGSLGFVSLAVSSVSTEPSLFLSLHHTTQSRYRWHVFTSVRESRRYVIAGLGSTRPGRWEPSVAAASAADK